MIMEVIMLVGGLLFNSFFQSIMTPIGNYLGKDILLPKIKKKIKNIKIKRLQRICPRKPTDFSRGRMSQQKLRR
jgi:hypothetical protein